MSIIEKALDKMGKSVSRQRKGSENNDDSNEQYKEVIEPENKEHSSKQAKVVETENMEAIKTDDEIKRSRSIELNIQKLKMSGYLAPGSINLAIAEQYRRIKRPILINAFDDKNAHIKHRNIIAVTSSVPKEGKSFTSLNLALSVAMELNQTALFIDADASRKTNSKLLGLNDEPGLTDMLLDENSDLSDYLLKTNIPDLSILPAGKTAENINELWASNRMSNLIAELSGRYSDRLVIIDCAPVLSESATNILTRQTGQVIFVIEAEKTSQTLIADALQLISDAEYIGLMLNKSNRSSLTEYSYYGRVNTPKPSSSSD